MYNSYSVYKKRNYSVAYIFWFSRIILIQLILTTGGNLLKEPQGFPIFKLHFIKKICRYMNRPIPCDYLGRIATLYGTSELHQARDSCSFTSELCKVVNHGRNPLCILDIHGLVSLLEKFQYFNLLTLFPTAYRFPFCQISIFWALVFCKHPYFHSTNWFNNKNKTWSSVSNSSLSKTFALCQFRIILGLKKWVQKSFWVRKNCWSWKEFRSKQIWVWKKNLG